MTKTQNRRSSIIYDRERDDKIPFNATEKEILKKSNKVIDDYLKGKYQNRPDGEKFLKEAIEKAN